MPTSAEPSCTSTRRAALGVTAASFALYRHGHAQTPTSRPITIIVPFTPGAGPDVVARLLAEGMQRRLGQPVVVDNRPGASGNIGAQAVARAAPDGHTLLVHTTSLVMNASLYRNLPYDPLGSFAPLLALVDVDYALVLHPSVGTSLAELIAQARARPGALNYATPGVGTPHHLLMELFKRSARVEVAHVPYRGAGPAFTGVMAGEVAAMFMTTSMGANLAREGRVRVVAVTTEARATLLPDVPTLAEAGVPDVIFRDWFGLLAPARTAPPIVDRLSTLASEVLRSPEVAGSLSGQGYHVLATAPEAFRARMTADLERWARVVREAGITAE